MLHVQWKAGYRAKTDAAKVYEELEKIRKRDGVISPHKVVEAAKSKKNPMHNEFTWDDGEAAQQWRVEQARGMSRAIHVVRVEAPHLQPARAFVQVTMAPEKEGGKPRRVYTDTAEALRDPITRQEILSRAINEALSYRRKYAQLQELAKVFHAMDEFVEKFG